MILTWDQVNEDIKGYYEKRTDKVISQKGLKMILTKFNKLIKPRLNSPMDILELDASSLTRRVRQVGKKTEEVLDFLRKKYKTLILEEKKAEEKEERFLAYKAKLDEEYTELKTKLEAQYNPKFKLKELYAFVQSLETCGIDSEHSDVEVDLELLEQFRKAVSIKLIK